eukprot:TRINITY_DN1024_c0_g1_i15.p1 TRINITY_DN1024_c0_g1~~TRINITY_DN1024_c0_g1_i15.p1  ORF type:complete len:109 (-),score=13.82 TRINITY_DN1024_c0_g1_i15:67-393(-)
MQIVRHRVGGVTFEIGTKTGSVLRFRNGQGDFSDVLQSEEIWKDISRADRANADELREAFKMTDTLEIAKLIAVKGTLQLTDAERKEIMRKKRNEIGHSLFPFQFEKS